MGSASLITVLEVGTLAVVIIGGFPLLATDEAVPHLVNLPSDQPALLTMFSGAFLAFFAFIGFEDIENMAEETKDPHRDHSCRNSVDARDFRGSLRTCCRSCCILS